jgi:hypothetical protein
VGRAVNAMIRECMQSTYEGRRKICFATQPTRITSHSHG